MNNAMTELHIRLVSCRNLRDTQTFGTQDPFAEVSMGGRTFKTKTHDNGGLTPVWNEKFVFTVRDVQMEQIHIRVKNENITNSKLIGECRLQVSMFAHGNVVDNWFALNKGNSRTGDINLRVQLVGAGIKAAKAPKAAQGYTPQQQQPLPAQPYPPQQYAPSAPPPTGPPAAYPPQPQYNPQLQQQAALQQQQQQAALQQQQQQLEMQRMQLQQQQAAMQQQQRAMASRPPMYAQPPQPVVYAQPPPQVVMAPPTVVAQPQVMYHGGGGYHNNYRQGGGMSGMAGAGLGLAGGLLLGAALGDDGGFDFD